MHNMYQGFMKLSLDELKLLEGKISVIDVQNGCPHQCLTCGVNAPKYKGSMPWKDFTTISDSILEVKTLKGINLMHGKNGHYGGAIAPFWSSDPVYYRSMDGGKERTLYDIAMNFHDAHSKTTLITTAGWNPNSYVQKAMEQIVEEHANPTFGIDFMYSIKTVTPNVIRDYDNFVKQGNNWMLIGKFVQESSYVKKIISNLTLMKEVLKNEKYMNGKSHVTYSLQMVNDKNLLSDTYPEKYSKYGPLFSEYLMDNVYNRILKELNWKEYEARTFGGMGNAINLGITKDSQVIKNENAINGTSNQWINNRLYHPMIDSSGKLNIYYGDSNVLSKLYVPKEHFQIMADKSLLPWERREYKLWAGLQGKNLLD